MRVLLTAKAARQDGIGLGDLTWALTVLMIEPLLGTKASRGG